MSPQQPNDPNASPQEPLDPIPPEPAIEQPQAQAPFGQQPTQQPLPSQQAPYGQQQPPYGQQPPPYGYPPASQPPNWPPAPGQQPGFAGPAYYPEQVSGTTILTLGIVAFFCAGIILGPIAWIMGNNALKAIDEGRADPMQRSTVAAGRICGIIATILAAVMIVIYGVAFTAGLIQGISHPGSYSSP
jgi:hypothetical protein